MAGISSLSMDTINRVLEAAGKQTSSGEGEGVSFASILKDTIANSEELNVDSNLSTLDLLTGNADNLSSILIASEKSEIALSLTAQIRNKAMDAYTQIMSMQV